MVPPWAWQIRQAATTNGDGLKRETGDAARAGTLARAHVRGSRDNVLRLLQAKSDYRNFLAKAS
ncbi:hypothetical protein [Mesorhizobium sp. M7A.F.Ca.US.006.01.1.1]|uniref:hypothetical protein n=1 Tax=Mesorhizobium sp. M7A.F.Ca.US.006.01.1.1 TaxID=2496707 RepID=UPI001FDEC7B1|nr:hypothetical protein [Mesorhizobium sp. M7A.F.Ca.US.006.01.1.1]